MRGLIVAATVGLVTSLASPACADWQYTRWEMTVDQALAASKGKLKRCDPQACQEQNTDKLAAELYGEHTAGDYTFTVFAMFDKRSGRLSTINLKLRDPTQGFSLVGSLITKYGDPAWQSVGAASFSNIWRTHTEQISVFVINPNPEPNSVKLVYQPRITQSNKGL